MFNCEFCRVILKTQKSLDRHQKSNKKCLILQGKDSYNCIKCGDKFTQSYNLVTHICRKNMIELYNEVILLRKKLLDIPNIEKQFELKIQNILLEKDEENKKLTAERDEVELENKQLLNDNINFEKQYENTILDLKQDIEDYKKQIFSIASQPKNTTNNNNQTNIKVDKMLVASLTEDMIKLKANEFMQIKHIDNGIKGYADFFIEHMKGTIACTDVSRNILKYRDDKNEIQTDTGGIATGKLFFNGISPAAMKLFTERYDYLQNLEISEEKKLEMVNVLIDNRSKMNSIVRGDIEGERERKDWARYVGSQCKV
jgi:hypothetical protein